MRKIFTILVCIFLVLLYPAGALAAVADPDSIAIPSVRVFQNLFSSGDQLFVIEEKVMYATNITQAATDAFFTMVNTATVNYTRPLPYYEHSLSAIYLTAAQAIPWGSATNITVSGNPVFFPTLTEGVNKETLSLGPGNWIAGSLTDSPGYLQAWCVTLAETLQLSWGITLLDSIDKLNAVGGQFFQVIIPGLPTICPSLFEVATEYVTPDSKTHSKAYETALLTRMGTGLHDAIQGIADVIHIPFTLTGLLLMGIMFFIIAGRVFTATGSPTMTIPITIPFLFASVIIGLIPLSVVFMVIAVVVVLGAVTFVLARVG